MAGLKRSPAPIRIIYLLILFCGVWFLYFFKVYISFIEVEWSGWQLFIQHLERWALRFLIVGYVFPDWILHQLFDDIWETCIAEKTKFNKIVSSIFVWVESISPLAFSWPFFSKLFLRVSSRLKDFSKR